MHMVTGFGDKEANAIGHYWNLSQLSWFPDRAPMHLIHTCVFGHKVLPQVGGCVFVSVSGKQSSVSFRPFLVFLSALEEVIS